MAPCADSPTDFVPPPSYQISQEQFDQKTSHAIQLSSSMPQPIIDEDGWPIYDSTVFEAVAKSYEHSPPGSSSAGLSGADTPRHRRQTSGLPSSTDSMKVRSSFLPFSHSIVQKFTPFHRLNPPNGVDGIPSQTPIIPQSVSQPLLHLSVQPVPLWMAHRLKKL